MTYRDLRIKRVYEPPDAADGTRILVDRLWPRGLSRERVKIDLWLNEIAPSDDLRRRLHRNPSAWGKFKTAYYDELEQATAQSALHALLDRLTHGPVTLLYAARDETRNNAAALKEWLEDRVAEASVGHLDRSS
jgi:uncharacterized protein YeaO (DUF488 family)